MSKPRMALTSLALAGLLGLLSALPGPTLTAAAIEEVKWSRVNIPAEDDSGDWVLASDSDVQHLTMAADGTLYAYANPSGTAYRLFKSTDAGRRWSPAGQVSNAIVAIAAAPDDARSVYYATAANVYKSTDAGGSFTLWGQAVGGAGNNNISITSLSVTREDNHYLLAAATRDSDAGQYGGVYLLDENKPFAGWTNTSIGNYDVYAIAFSPAFNADRQLVAVTSNETATIVTSRIRDTSWGSITGATSIEAVVPVSAAIAFPGGYDASAKEDVLFVALSTGSGNGDVYKVYATEAPGNSTATDLNIGGRYNLNGVDVTGLAASGNATATYLLAGAASGTQVYSSADGGANWIRSKQKPSGQSGTEVLMAADFALSGIAYAATSGDENAFSYTADGGVTWRQTGLIDTRISDSGIIDLAISPDYERDSALFMLTFDAVHTEHSLWRSPDGGTQWERILTSEQTSADQLRLIELSPQYGGGNKVVFLAGTISGNPSIWKSSDNGQNFTPLGAPSAVDIWKIADDNTLFIGGYDGSNGLVYRSSNGGLSYPDATAVGSQPLTSIALSPGYQQDKTLLLGNSNGWVYWSEDNGDSFKRLGQQLPSSSGAGEVAVAFDPGFGSNRTI